MDLMSNSQKLNRFVKKLSWWIVCLAATVVFLFPFAWMVLTAFKPRTEVMSYQMTFWPEEFILTNFTEAWAELPWGRFFFNSVFITASATIGLLFFTSLAGFAFAKLDFPFKKPIFLGVIATMIVPIQVDLIPRFLMMTAMGLVGTYAPIIILALVHGMQTFLYRQSFMGFPQELIDAARVDGAGYFRIYWTLGMKHAKPITAALAVFTIVMRWNDLLYALIYLTDESIYTVQIGLAVFQARVGPQYNLLMAASTFVTLPTIIAYLFFQRKFVRGITLSGID